MDLFVPIVIFDLKVFISRNRLALKLSYMFIVFVVSLCLCRNVFNLNFLKNNISQFYGFDTDNTKLKIGATQIVKLSYPLTVGSNKFINYNWNNSL